MRILFCLILISSSFFQNTVLAQQPQPKKKMSVSFASYNTFSLFNGYETIHAGFQTANGVLLDNTFIGAGAGIDWYGARSVPVFGELRQQIRIGKLWFFLYGDLGYNFPWDDSESGNQFFNTTDRYSRGGLYYDIGAGYLIPFRKRNAMVLSAGYSVKESSEYYGYSPCSRGAGNCDVTYEKYSYHYNRLIVKIGWKF